MKNEYDKNYHDIRRSCGLGSHVQISIRTFSAPEAMPNLPFGRDKKRPGFFVMKWTSGFVIDPGFLEFEVA